MHVDVDEPVEVVAVFLKDRAIPTQLKWGDRTYKISNINMVHQSQDGDANIHYFSVTDGSNHFRLAFDAKSLKWNLEQVYYQS